MRYHTPLVSRIVVSIAHDRELTTVHDRSVVRPNVDTLYSTILINLSADDLMVDLPVVDDRYWVSPFYDIYRNQYYLVRYARAVDKEPGVPLCIQSTTEQGGCEYGIIGFITAPTPYGLTLPHLALKNNGTDLTTVHATQDNKSVQTRARDNRYAPPLTLGMLNASLSTDPVTRILELTARIALYNPPRNISDSPRVNSTLEAAGIRDGEHQQQIRDLEPIAVAAQSSVMAEFNPPGNVMTLQNGWQQLTPEVQGDFGTNYNMRTFAAGWGNLVLRASASLYPITEPIIEQNGFWSLTAYGPDRFLILNSLNRTPVYGNDSSADVALSEEWMSHWLPASAGGGDMNVTPRLYALSDELSSGGWTFPQVEKIQAISARGIR
ncbi:hypothetical protein BDW59DRAFT_173405 [Aspergillus cavernicola]|uniref:DUF1254 domain-containing protein n=1 Tax=Aspergillus cavernicola TaxID=176166 RepID=A0ABR4I766_9EURO